MDDVLAAQRAYDSAELSADTGRLESLLADDFRSIGERGYVLDKQQWIARHGDFRYVSVDTSETEVRTCAGAAIVSSVQRSRAVWLGTAMALSVRVSHVWVAEGQGWKAPARHGPVSGRNHQPERATSTVTW